MATCIIAIALNLITLLPAPAELPVAVDLVGVGRLAVLGGPAVGPQQSFEVFGGHGGGQFYEPGFVGGGGDPCAAVGGWGTGGGGMTVAVFVGVLQILCASALASSSFFFKGTKNWFSRAL